MRAVDIIIKKRDHGELTGEEIDFFVQGYNRAEIPDYQAAAWAMAVMPVIKVPGITNRVAMVSIPARCWEKSCASMCAVFRRIPFQPLIHLRKLSDICRKFGRWACAIRGAFRLIG